MSPVAKHGDRVCDLPELLQTVRDIEKHDSAGGEGPKDGEEAKNAEYYLTMKVNDYEYIISDLKN